MAAARSKGAVRKGAALGAGAAGGIALAALVLPQLANPLNPTKVGAALLTVALALLSAAAQRLVERYKSRDAVAGAARVWPIQRLGDADPASLGVYPPYGADGSPEPYRARAEDASLRKALTDSKVVIVHGPPGAGKSRAASEAAREVLTDVPVIVPLNPDALRSLADGSVRLRIREPRVCLWLDGLDRFIDVLDAGALEVLDGVAAEVKLVATIRTEELEKLLSGTGQETDAARALAASARAIELGPLPTASAASEHATTQKKTLALAVRGPAQPWRDAWLAALGAGLLITLIAMALLGRSDDLLEPEPIEDQISDIRSSVLSGGDHGRRHVVVDKRVRFHPGEADSWLLVVQDRPSHDEFYAAATKGGGTPPRSDEVRVYDVRHGELRLRLHFQPKGIGREAAGWRVLGSGAPVAADYDRDSSDEVIAGYAIPSQATEALVPLAIDWDGGAYRLISLTPNRPELSNRGLDRAAIRFRREAYQEPRTFENAIRDRRFRDLKVRGYRVQTLAVDSERPRLFVGYFARLPEFGKTKVLELSASQLRSGEPALVPCTPKYAACRAPARPHDVIVPPSRTLDGAMLEAWKAVREKWDPSVEVVERKP